MTDAQTWDDRYQSVDLMWSSEPNCFVAEEVSKLEPGRALDLACGEGRNTLWLSRQGWIAHGVDFSNVAIERARVIATKQSSKATFEVGDVTAWSTDERYDLVLLSYLHPPKAQRHAAIRSAATSVAPGGSLLVVAHDRSNLTHGHGGPQDPDVLYGVEDVLGDVGDLEFEPVVAQVRERTVTIDDQNHAAIDLVVHLFSQSELGNKESQ